MATGCGAPPSHWILDNLFAKGKAKPMVVVMMDGHAATPGPGGQDNTALFERDLLEEVLPFVESQYRVVKNPASRALAGLSMGGGQALTVGLNHVEIFGWVGAFSAAPPDRQRVASALGKPAKTNADLKLLWIACGKEDFLLKRNQDFIQVLADTGVKHQWLLTEGNHSWPVWRLYLADFAPLLF
jgi:enterochelin esterase-like enzyme